MGIIRCGGIGSDFIANAVGNGLFTQGMFLIPLFSVDRTDIGYGGTVKAGGRGHGEIVKQTATDCQVREEVGDRVVEEKNIGEVVESGG